MVSRLDDSARRLDPNVDFAGRRAELTVFEVEEVLAGPSSAQDGTPTS